MEPTKPQENSTEEFQPREYQIELFEKAIKRNTIIFLPTGSGKTFIATMVIKYKSKDIERKFSEGGKRTFFLVNTVALVDQQGESLRKQLPFTIGKYSGDIGVDYWDLDKWKQELENNQILIMTSQIFLNMLCASYIHLSRVNLIVFDECHHAVNKHAMRQIMERFGDVEEKDKPHVLGLTATLLLGNVKAERISKEIHDLEVTLQAKISRAKNEEMIKAFSTNPQEEIIYYDCPEEDRCNKIIEFYIENMLMFINTYCLEENHQFESPKEGLVLIKDSKNCDMRNLRNLLKEIKNVCDNLGGYAAKYALLSKLVTLERQRIACSSTSLHHLYGFIISQVYEMRKELSFEMEKYDEAEQPFKFSTPKLKKLFDIFRNFPEDSTALVFVVRRITAKVLFYVFGDILSSEEYSGVKPDFIVGVNAPGDTREGFLERRNHKDALKRFNKHETNVLFASDVIEEGIDISHCNFVIKFDDPSTFCSYIQSKGRARHKDSKYFVFVEANKKAHFQKTYDNFRLAEHRLTAELSYGRDELRQGGTREEAELYLYSCDIKPFAPCGPEGPVITITTAISLLNRYCQTLPQDKFTNLTVTYWKEKKDMKTTVYLQLPPNSPLREIVKGQACDNIETAKASAALEACKKLYYLNEFNSFLLPVGNAVTVEELQICPLWDSIDLESANRPGTKKRRRLYDKKVPVWLCNCKPKANVPSYIHVIKTIPNYKPYPTNRHLVFYDLLNSPSNFAIITSKKWPKICDFPMFMNVGELKIEVIVNAETLILSKSEIEELFEFHTLVFTELLSLKKKFLVKDLDSVENDFCIIPVIETKKGFQIDFNTIKSHKHITDPKEIPPEERKHINITNNMYHGKVVIPWYRPTGFMLKYIVTKVCTDQNPQSKFPSEHFSSYAHYFLQRYNQKIVNMDQPLLEVRAISTKSNCLIPRGKLRHGKRRRRDEDDLEEILIPELCTLIEFPSVYMLKVTLLPSVIHRLNFLFTAEELRQQIALALQLGRTTLPNSMKWSAVCVDLTAINNNDDDDAQVKSTIEISNMLTDKMDSLIPKDCPWDKDEEPCDIERNIKTVDLLTIKHYDKFTSKKLEIPHDMDIGVHTKVDNITVPAISILEKKNDSIGPQLAEIHKVVICATSNDIVNYERLETLGDSYLKYFVSLVLFTYFPSKDEGKLSSLKGQIIGNRNLFYCGRNLQLGSMLKVNDFSAEECDIPYYNILKSLRDLMKEARLTPGSLYQVSLNKFERETGILSEESCYKFLEALANVQDDANENDNPGYGQQSVADKVIADSVEALIGAYLEGCGIEGAAMICKWLQIISEDISDLNKLFAEKPESPIFNDLKSPAIDSLIMMPSALEESLGYKFRNRGYLLQAITHSSYNHGITDCFQRLEFLGDAILDFLITSYIYENCNKLSPGDLTDLRSALVNNVTFACLTARYGFHKHLLMKVWKLTDVVNKFVSHQEKRHHKIGAEVLFLIDENDVQAGEIVDVPKILGDLFESLAGAVYLDSGKSLKKVWEVFYRLMHKEIEQFSNDVPKNNIRLLFEKFPSPAPFFGKTKIHDGRVSIPLHVTHNGDVKTFHGVGDKKATAKLAAAKVALRYYHHKS